MDELGASQAAQDRQDSSERNGGTTNYHVPSVGGQSNPAGTVESA
jgi:hypothetical protein